MPELPDSIVVRGRLVSPVSVELEHPVTAVGQSVDVIVPAPPAETTNDIESLLEWIEALPPGTRTKEEIDRQVREERDSWER